jgi:hypothetical protein
MKVKPNVGDIVVTERIAGSYSRYGETREETVTKVGRDYFYTDRNTAFELESFANGAWADKYSDVGASHNFKAYQSWDDCHVEHIRQSRISEIKKVGWEYMSAKKIQAVYALVFATTEAAYD